MKLNLEVWYPGPDSNRHEQSPPDFESSVSTNFTTWARKARVKLYMKKS